MPVSPDQYMMELHLTASLAMFSGPLKGIFTLFLHFLKHSISPLSSVQSKIGLLLIPARCAIFTAGVDEVDQWKYSYLNGSLVEYL